MSKMSELSLAIDELKRCGEALIGISETLADLFSTKSSAEYDDKPTVEVSAPVEVTVSLEEVRAVLAEKSRSGHTTEVRELLLKHGASKLSEITPTEYAALLTDAEVLGNG